MILLNRQPELMLPTHSQPRLPVSALLSRIGFVGSCGGAQWGYGDNGT